jgi:hypothetical protein
MSFRLALAAVLMMPAAQAQDIDVDQYLVVAPDVTVRQIPSCPACTRPVTTRDGTDSCHDFADKAKASNLIDINSFTNVNPDHTNVPVGCSLPTLSDANAGDPRVMWQATADANPDVDEVFDQYLVCIKEGETFCQERFNQLCAAADSTDSGSNDPDAVPENSLSSAARVALAQECTRSGACADTTTLVCPEPSRLYSDAPRAPGRAVAGGNAAMPGALACLLIAVVVGLPLALTVVVRNARESRRSLVEGPADSEEAEVTMD